MKKIGNVFEIFLGILLIAGYSLEYFSMFAPNGIKGIDIDIYIDENGDASVTEVWNCKAYSGTEWYHPYYNLMNSEIKNLSVSENGKKYEIIENWNTEASQSYKKEKCGLNNISDGVEICWGMGDYGKHEYKVNYTITNFVEELRDAQMIYWTLIPKGMSDNVGKASVKISAYKPFGENTSMWGYGDAGINCNVIDGDIVVNAKNGILAREWVTLLIKLPIDFFDTDNFTGGTFYQTYEMANTWDFTTDYDIDNFIVECASANPLLTLIGFFVFCYGLIALIGYGFTEGFVGLEKLFNPAHPALQLFSVLLTILAIVNWGWISVVILLIIGVIANKMIKDGIVIKNKIKKSEVIYYREIPCNGDIFKTYYIAYQYGLIKNESDFLGAVILKWIKEKRAIVLDKNFDSKNDSISLNREYYTWKWDNIYEQQLYQMMFEASGDGILEKKELQKWCNNKLSNLQTWFKSVLTYEQGKLINTQELLLEKEGRTVNYKDTEKMYLEGKQIYGLKKYLKDFTRIHMREPVEVELFEEYLIIAQMLGIAKEVIKQFNELYPNIISDSNFKYGDYLFVHTTSHRTIRRAHYRTRIRSAMSSGVGGSHGGGSRGGGRGGGGRR